jgi:hypothetical protein
MVIHSAKLSQLLHLKKNYNGSLLERDPIVQGS